MLRSLCFAASLRHCMKTHPYVTQQMDGRTVPAENSNVFPTTLIRIYLPKKRF